MGPFDPVVPYNQPSPLFPERAPYQQYNPWGFGGSGMGQLAVSMIGNLVASQMHGTPMGMLGLNPYNNMQRTVFDMQHRDVISRSLSGDLVAATDNVRGIFNMAGMEFNRDQERNFLLLSRHAMQAGMAIDPHGTAMLSDFLTGGRGQGAMAAMTHLAGRSIVDPVTGRMGLGTDSTTQLTQQLYDSLGFNDPYGWRKQTRGLTAGQMGGLLDEGIRRGMFQVEAAPGGGGIDATRLKTQLQNYTKSISAVREIFGDQGRPDAPMAELMRALETLTLGANYQLDAGRTEMTVRNMYNAARRVGVGMDGLGQLLSASGAQVQGLGLMAPWATQAVTRSLNYQAGIGSSGMFANPGWGMPTPEQVMAANLQLNNRNAASELSNNFGAMARLADRFGLRGGAGRRVSDWLRMGAAGTTAGELIDMSRGELLTTLQQATGRSMEEIERVFEQTSRNEEASFNGGFAGAVEQGSRQELAKVLMRDPMNTVASGNIRRVMGRNFAGGKLATSLTTAVENALINTPMSAMSTTGSRNKVLAGALGRELNRSAEGRKLKSRLAGSSIGLDAELLAMAEDMYFSAEADLLDQGLLQPGERLVGKFASAADPAATAASRKASMVNQIDSLIGSAMAGQRDPTMVGRMLSAIQQAGYDPKAANMQAVLGNMFGIQGNDPLIGQLSGMIGDMQAGQKAWEKKRDALRGATSPEARAALQRQLEDEASALSDRINKLEQFITTNPALHTAWQERKAAEDAKAAAGEEGENVFNIGELTLNVGGLGSFSLKSLFGSSSGKRGSAGGK